MRTPRLLDLFCGGGGASMGYHRAGFEVVGVDVEDHAATYPFEFVRADAMTFDLAGFDVIAASPPCHDKSFLKSVSGLDGSGWMLAATIERLRRHGRPFVVENVVGAKDDMGEAWVQICGASMGLVTESQQRGPVWLRRHRLFASNIALLVPPCGCSRRKKVIGVYGNGGNGDSGGRGWKGSHQDRTAVMGIDWMSRKELSQAIPPAYTEWIGHQLIDYLALTDV